MVLFACFVLKFEGKIGIYLEYIYTHTHTHTHTHTYIYVYVYNWSTKELYLELFSENYLSIIEIFLSFPPEENYLRGNFLDC